MSGEKQEKWEDYREKAVRALGPWKSETLTDHVSYGRMQGRPVGLQHRGALEVVMRQDVMGEPCVVIHAQPIEVPDMELHAVESPLGDGDSKHVKGTIDQIKEQLDAALREAGYRLFDE